MPAKSRLATVILSVRTQWPLFTRMGSSLDTMVGVATEASSALTDSIFSSVRAAPPSLAHTSRQSIARHSVENFSYLSFMSFYLYYNRGWGFSGIFASWNFKIVRIFASWNFKIVRIFRRLNIKILPKISSDFCRIFGLIHSINMGVILVVFVKVGDLPCGVVDASLPH